MSEEKDSQNPINPRRLGWLQLQLLTMLWNSEMYGLELKKMLALKGERVSPGQLYPALNRLEEAGLLESKEEARVGANRKFYWATERGKQTVISFLLDFLAMFEDFFWEEIDFLFDEVVQLADFSPGTIVGDFSRYHPRQVFDIVRRVGPTGRYYFFNSIPDMAEIFQAHAEHFELEHVITIIDATDGLVPLHDGAIDIGLVLFTIHEDDTEWIVKELGRLLKPDGVGIIVDAPLAVNPAESLLIKIFGKLVAGQIPRHTQLGRNLQKLPELLEKYHLILSESKIHEDIQFFVVTKAV